MGENRHIVGHQRVHQQRVRLQPAVHTVNRALAYHPRAVVVESHRMLRLVQLAAHIHHVQQHLGLVTAEAENIVQRLREILLVLHRKHTARTRGMGRHLAPDAEHKSLHHHAAQLHLPRHIANLRLAVVHAVRDNQNQIAARTRGRKIAQRVRQRRRSRAAPLRHQSLDLALQTVDIVAPERHLKPRAELLLVQVAEHTQRHIHLLAVPTHPRRLRTAHRIQERQQHLLRHLDFRIALPVVPHRIRTVQNNQQPRLLLLPLDARRLAPGRRPTAASQH